ncbi:MAG TPA: cupin domain-containing protein [Vicinamibacteria bacterium]|nr:cupin domain-containing protein [Vicinamibacteria bacterium]
MARILAGGCRVWALTEGRPRRLGRLKIWNRAGRRSGARAISLRVMELEAGLSPGMRTAKADEVLYVLKGQGTFYLDGWPHAAGPDTGIYVRPGTWVTIDNPGPGSLMLLSSRCPDPGNALVPAAPRTVPAPGALPMSAPPLVRVADRPSETTGDRSYRVLVDPSVGCEAVTQFVGTIPPGRSPDHFHLYEEVLCILEGRGRMWAGRSHAPIGPGSCVFLPRRQVHCVENTGSGPLRLLGVFYPAGSPAVRRYRNASSSRNATPRK